MAAGKPPTVADIVAEFLYHLAETPPGTRFTKGPVPADKKYANFATKWVDSDKKERREYIDSWLKKNKYAGPDAAQAADLLLRSDYVEIRRVTANPSVVSWIAIWIALPHR
jgi:hypothetical protein